MTLRGRARVQLQHIEAKRRAVRLLRDLNGQRVVKPTQLRLLHSGGQLSAQIFLWRSAYPFSERLQEAFTVAFRLFFRVHRSTPFFLFSIIHKTRGKIYSGKCQKKT